MSHGLFLSGAHLRKYRAIVMVVSIVMGISWKIPNKNGGFRGICSIPISGTPI